MHRDPHIHFVLRIAFCAVLSAPLASRSQTQPQSPNGVQIGMTKFGYNACMVPGDMNGIASASVFTPSFAKTLFGKANDFDNDANLKCASQLHENRCASQLIEFLGDAQLNLAASALSLGNLPNAPKSRYDPVVIGTVGGAVVGGAVGFVKGAEFGHPVIGTLGGAAAGGFVGNKVGGWAQTSGPVASCNAYRKYLEYIVNKMKTPPSALIAPLPISSASTTTAIEENVAAGAITQAQAETLTKEIQLLTGRLTDIMRVLGF